MITGAARRLGASIARRFGAEGWHVVIHCNRSRDDALQLARELPSAEVVACDLDDSDAATALVEQLADRLGDWRVLVNSASIFPADPTGGIDPVGHARTMRINAETPTRMAQTYFRAARSAFGRKVIDVTDQKLKNPNPDFLSYTMSKHALASTIPMLAMTSRKVDRIYGLAPGAILQSFDQTAEEFERASRLNLLARHTSPAEIADAAWFLAQGLLASGETLFVDSGQHLLHQGRDVIYLARDGGMQ